MSTFNGDSLKQVFGMYRSTIQELSKIAKNHNVRIELYLWEDGDIWLESSEKVIRNGKECQLCNRIIKKADSTYDSHETYIVGEDK